MSLNSLDKFAIVILAAGKGARMKSNLPKVMHLLKDKPLIDYVVKSVENKNDRIVVVKATDNDLVKDFLQNRVKYAIQDKQLGTGHAVMSAEKLINGYVDHIVVLYGDMPFITGKSIDRLKLKHLEKGNTMTLMTTIVPDFNDWRDGFYSFGRIVRRADGHIAKIIEKKDATEQELAIKEVNPSYLCFKADWLWENLKKLKNNNSQGEYYLTDLLKMAIDSGKKISSIDINYKEALGVNNKNDLMIVQKFLV